MQSNAPFWYSYNYGSVHFTVISTEHSLEPDSEQYRVRCRLLCSAALCRDVTCSAVLCCAVRC